MWRHAGALSGVLFGVLEIVGFALGAAGVPRASKEEIARAYLGGTSGSAWLGQYLALLSALCFLVFAARLRDALRADDGLDWISTSALLGAVLFATGDVIGVGAYGAIRARAGSGLDASEAVSLADLGQALVVLAVAGLGLFLLAVSVRILQTRGLPRWLGWSGAILGCALLVVVAIPLLRFGMAVEPLVLLWILAVAVALIRAAGQSPDRKG